jgi:2-keto-4-pentenoate hydratase/2-oxohepta-3-ene-1,7-dioic acid hydratase in catechol pathway
VSGGAGAAGFARGIIAGHGHHSPTGRLNVRLGTFREPHSGREAGGVVIGDRIVALEDVRDLTRRPVAGDLSRAIRDGQIADLRDAVSRAGGSLYERGLPLDGVQILAPYRDPPKIWCIGLNYREHAADLDERSPDEPASFMRPACSIRGPRQPICLPPESARVTGEAELAVVIGRRAKYVSRHEAHAVIAGFVPAIDMTAEDILRRNPRFLTRAKSFDTFLSLGPFIVTADEIGDEEAVRRLEVSTMLNGQAIRTGAGVDMQRDVYDLIAFHSRVFTWEAGDLLLTGTPGAVVLAAGDIIGCRIPRVGELVNPVARLPPDGVA